jgi:hypothetical protein
MFSLKLSNFVFARKLAHSIYQVAAVDACMQLKSAYALDSQQKEDCTISIWND